MSALQARPIREWVGDRKTGQYMWFCLYPDGTRKLCMGEDVAKDLADKCNSTLAIELEAAAGEYSA